MADVAQLVRALVCGTRCREFESHLPPHKKTSLSRGAFFMEWEGGSNSEEDAKQKVSGGQFLSASPTQHLNEQGK